MEEGKSERNVQDRSTGEPIIGPTLDDVQSLGMTPLPSDPAALHDEFSRAPESVLSPEHQHDNYMNPTEENMQTPKSGPPPSKELLGRLGTSSMDQNPYIPRGNDDERPKGSASSVGDYFYPVALTHHVENSSPAPMPASLGISTEENLASPNINAFSQDSPGEPLTTWKHISPHTVQPPTSDPATLRPTSVPNLPSTSPHRQGDAHDNIPRYPDQTFACLGPRQNPPPLPTRISRTRSSHSPSWSVSASHDFSTKDFGYTQSGAKTVGNTPAQSPGLYSPSPKSPILLSRKRAPDSDDGRPSSQILHASHLQAPIETHKLNKDIDPISGRKVLNNYELIDKLGSGQHGTVKRGRNLQTNELVAVKIVRRFSKKLRLGKPGDPNDMIKKEVAILKKARHPHVVSLFEVIDDAEFDKVYLVLEFVERGEIVWRKLTDKAIAQFEMERLERERKYGYIENIELQAIEKFNSQVSTRRLEKSRLLEEQKSQARERLAAGKRASRLDPFWSLEYGEEPEQESTVSHRHEYQRDDVRLSRADIHAAETARESPESATPVRARQSISLTQALNTEFSTSQPSSLPTSAPSSVPPSQPSSQPASQPPSRPETPSLEGSMYGPYVEIKSKSDLEFQHTLQEIIEQQDENWSAEEENYRYVPCLTLSQALEAFRDTVLGLEYLHYQGIIHRDIKPANLLWTTDYRVKISDFGVSYLGKPIREDSNHEEIPEADADKYDEALELAKTVGTPAFYAPELCDLEFLDENKHPQRPPITGQIDVWALGVTLYCMVFGRLPFVDHNEFRMYEKIAKEEVFIPRLRLRGVSHTDKTPSNHNKRLDDVLEYEEVDNTLRDLLKRLLAKHPAQRISLKEVKHHPWVVSGIENKDSWLDETDPSRQSQGKKIEVSTQEVQDAVVGLNLFDRVAKGVQRLSSVLRGGRSRKRTNSNPKLNDSSGATSALKARESRRASLRADDQFTAALKQSREAGEHPLAQSVAASPEIRAGRSYFAIDGGDARPQSAIDPISTSRPSESDHAMSTADSMKTITARDPPPLTSVLPPQPSSSSEDFAATTTTVVDPNSSSSSLGGLFGGAGRRLVKSFRSRERGPASSQSSRSSSVDPHHKFTEDCHSSPSLGLSSASAAGYVDLPPALREEAQEYPLPHESSAESFQRAQAVNRRRHQAEFASTSGGHRRSVSYAADVACPPSPDDETYFHHPRPASATESSFAISSSSDQIVSGESTAHSRIPSEVSGASSLSATIEEDPPHAALQLEKSISPLTIGRRSVERPRSEPVGAALMVGPFLAKAQQDEEAGYNGEGELDSDSDDEGLAMA